MKIEHLLFFIFACILMACGPYKEFERTPEHERHVTKVRADRYKKHSFVGKWMEYKRTNRKSEIAFTDTLRYDFYGDSSVNIFLDAGKIKKAHSGRRKKHGFYVGKDNFYKKFYMRNGFMTLRKKKVTHFLKKVDRYYLPPMKKISPGLEQAEIGPLDALFFQGEWKIYKKTDPSFNKKNTYLQKLIVSESNADGTYEVEAFYNTDRKIAKDKGSLAVENETITLSVMNQTKSYTVIGAMDAELILKDGAVVYFMKKIAD